MLVLHVQSNGNVLRLQPQVEMLTRVKSFVVYLSYIFIIHILCLCIIVFIFISILTYYFCTVSSNLMQFCWSLVKHDIWFIWIWRNRTIDDSTKVFNARPAIVMTRGCNCRYTLLLLFARYLKTTLLPISFQCCTSSIRVFSCISV
jgi:hypothetical protein